MNLLLQWNLLFPAKESAVRYLNNLGDYIQLYTIYIKQKPDND